MKTHRYVICNVFTDRPLSGSTLAVFTRATELNDREMQGIAREMRLNATVFVQPPEQGGHAKLKVFTPLGALPFQSNAALAAAIVLGGPLQAQVVRFETTRGAIHVALERDGARIVFGWFQEPLPPSEPYPASAQLLAALGISEGGLSATLFQAEPRCVLVEHPSLEELSKLAPHREELESLAVDCVTTFAGASGSYRMRVFLPHQVPLEEPATGSAAGLVALHLFRQGRLELESTLTIEQGAEIGRSSSLCAKLSHSDAGEEVLLVGGSAIVVGRGELMV
jgi:trans-2,3-dihydro-3-hydroxyanthranilate isomerase